MSDYCCTSNLLFLKTFYNKVTISLGFVETECLSQQHAGLYALTTIAKLHRAWDCYCASNHLVSFNKSLLGM